MTFQHYNEALDYLYHRNEFAIKLGLDNMERFLKERVLSVQQLSMIHVAGTNGKGSVCWNLSQWLRELGFKKVGLFTSPHLIDFKERIRVDGVCISNEWVLNWINSCRDLLEKIGMTYFECVTAMAFEYFENQSCEVVVLETGLGGRLDATNCITPVVSVITSVSLDHCSILGNTLEAIWKEKLGIVKQEVPLVVQASSEAEQSWVEAAVEKKKTKVIYVNEVNQTLPRHFGTVKKGAARDNLRLSLKTLEVVYPLLKKTKSSELPDLSACSLPRPPFRQQFFSQKGLPRLLLDVAHNRESVQALRAVKEKEVAEKSVVIFSLMEDKELEVILEEVAAMDLTEFYFVELKVPRGLKYKDLKALYPEGKCPWKKLELTHLALDQVLNQDKEACVMVFGSFYLLGEALPLLTPFYPALAEVL